MRFWNQEETLGAAPTEGRVDEETADERATFHSLRSETFDRLTANTGVELKFVNLVSAETSSRTASAPPPVISRTSAIRYIGRHQ